MKNNSIYVPQDCHIGQMTVERAQSEIARMEQQTNVSWKMDFTPFLQDDDQENPNASKLKEGYCWVIMDKNIPSIQEVVNCLESILELGRKDLSNPKYDGYFQEAKRILSYFQDEPEENEPMFEYPQ